MPTPTRAADLAAIAADIAAARAALECVPGERARWAWQTAGEPDDPRREEAICVLECVVGNLHGWRGGDEQEQVVGSRAGTPVERPSVPESPSSPSLRELAREALRSVAVALNREDEGFYGPEERDDMILDGIEHTLRRATEASAGEVEDLTVDEVALGLAVFGQDAGGQQ